MSLNKEVMLCVHSILLPSTVQPSASTEFSLRSISSSAWTDRCRAIRPTISRGPTRTPLASRLQSPASPTLISRSRRGEYADDPRREAEQPRGEDLRRALPVHHRAYLR